MPEMMEKTSLDPNNLPGNSFFDKEKKKPTKVIQGKTITRRKTLGRKFADLFIGENIDDVKSYVFKDVLIPTLKATFVDVVWGTVNMLVYPGQSRPRPGNGRSTIGYTPYNSLNRNTPFKEYQNRSTPRYGIDEIIVGTRSEADDVLYAMIDYMKEYDGMISVADLYEMVGHPIVFTDNNWGWTDLRTASIRKIPEGYLLVLPRPVSLK